MARMNYTYTAIYNRTPPKQEKYPPPASYGRSYSVGEELDYDDRYEYAKPSGSKDTVMLAILFFVLPVLGLLAILMKQMRWVFFAATLISVVALLGFRSFLPKARFVTFIILVGLSAISLMTALAKPPLSSGNPAKNGTITPGINDPRAVVTNTPPSGVVGALWTPTPPPGSDDTKSASSPMVSDAEKTLTEFMELWRTGAMIEDFVKYTWEEWRESTNGNPGAVLSYIVSTYTNTLIGYSIDAPVIADMDTSATFSVTIEQKLQNDTIAKKRLDVIMHKKDGSWYVDPNSLKGGVPVTDPTPKPGGNASATPKPTTTVKPTTMLWYNSKGGEFYHLKKDCSTIGPKYLGKLSSFTYAQLPDSRYKALKPCKACGAPARPQ